MAGDWTASTSIATVRVGGFAGVFVKQSVLATPDHRSVLSYGLIGLRSIRTQMRLRLRPAQCTQERASLGSTPTRDEVVGGASTTRPEVIRLQL